PSANRPRCTSPTANANGMRLAAPHPARQWWGAVVLTQPAVAVRPAWWYHSRHEDHPRRLSRFRPGAQARCGVILPKVRDPRFITIRRGGTLTDADHRLLALWAAGCAERVL